MKYLITENRLQNIFSKYIKDVYGDLSIDIFDGISYVNSDGEKEIFGYVEYNRNEGKFTYYFYFKGSDKYVRTFESMFGNQWDDFLLKHIQEMFPQYNIEEIQY